LSLRRLFVAACPAFASSPPAPTSAPPPKDGVLSDLRRKWFIQMSSCNDPRDAQQDSASGLGPDNVSAVFIMLAAGMGLAILWAVAEMLYYRYGYGHMQRLKNKPPVQRALSRLKSGHFRCGAAAAPRLPQEGPPAAGCAWEVVPPSLSPPHPPHEAPHPTPSAPRPLRRRSSHDLQGLPVSSSMRTRSNGSRGGGDGASIELPLHRSDLQTSSSDSEGLRRFDAWSLPGSALDQDQQRDARGAKEPGLAPSKAAGAALNGDGAAPAAAHQGAAADGASGPLESAPQAGRAAPSALRQPGPRAPVSSDGSRPNSVTWREAAGEEGRSRWQPASPRLADPAGRPAQTPDADGAQDVQRRGPRDQEVEASPRSQPLPPASPVSSRSPSQRSQPLPPVPLLPAPPPLPLPPADSPRLNPGRPSAGPKE
jgi:hypothetical protein